MKVITIHPEGGNECVHQFYSNPSSNKVEIFHRMRENYDLLVAIEGSLKRDLNSGDHECFCKISWKSFICIL